MQRQDVVCKIFGEDLDTLARYADRLVRLLRVYKAENIFVETVTGVPQIIIDYHREQLSRYGVSISEVNRLVNMAFAGKQAGLVYEGEKRFSLVVRLAKEHRQDLEAVRSLLVPLRGGSNVPCRTWQTSTSSTDPIKSKEDAKRRMW